MNEPLSKITENIIAVIVAVCLATAIAYAEPKTTTDPRYCGCEPKRNVDGKILRSVAERKRFEALYPLPLQYNRDEWQVDHIIPLANGGVDKIINMQWLPKKIKTCADDMCKDRFERVIYKNHLTK